MKTLNILIAIATLLCISTITLSAQTTSIWQGGKPGRATDWNCAANWKDGRLPDELSQVIIPAGRAFYPVIKSDVTSIDALMVEGSAILTISKGASLTIVGETGRLNGVTIFGNIENEGVLQVPGNIALNQAILQNIQKNDMIITQVMSIVQR